MPFAWQTLLPDPLILCPVLQVKFITVVNVSPRAVFCPFEGAVISGQVTTVEEQNEDLNDLQLSPELVV